MPELGGSMPIMPEWLSGEVLKEQLGYWEEQLRGAPEVHSVPLDRIRGVEQSYAGAVVDEDYGVGGGGGLRQVAASGQGTLFMALHGMLGLLLARHSGSEDIVIGTPVANRLQKEVEPFANTVALRTRCGGRQSWREYLEQVRRVNMEAQGNQEVPFELAVEGMNPQRSNA